MFPLRHPNEASLDAPSTIIINLGSHSLKYSEMGGKSNKIEMSPRMTPALVGRQRFTGVCMLSVYSPPDAYVGDEVYHPHVIYSLRISCPFENGFPSNFDDLEKIFHSTFFHQSSGNIEEQSVVLCEPILFPRQSRERLVQIMFETFASRRVVVLSQPLMILHKFGTTEGIVIDSGHQRTTCIPVFQGTVIPYKVKSVNIGGSNLTSKLREYVAMKHSIKYIEKISLDALKEMICSVNNGRNDEHEEIKFVFKGIEFSSFSVRNLGECLLLPDNNGNTIPEIIYNTVAENQSLAQSIYFVGGNSNLAGFAERLTYEVNKISNEFQIKLTPAIDASLLSWQGAQQYVDETDVESLGLVLEEYDEYGPIRIHKYCS